jgi:hypothetical protein
MKTLIITLVSLTLLVVVGCQENSISEPVVSESIDKILPIDEHQHNIIPLQQLLNDPYPIGNSYYRISGQIEYEFHNAVEDLGQAASKYHISLRLAISADLHYFCSVCSPSEQDDLAGFIQADSEDYFSLDGTSSRTLEKSFTIQGREDGMVLKCRFSVSVDGIELNAMWLALPPQNLVHN